MESINYTTDQIKRFVKESPFPHVMLPNFFKLDVYQKLKQQFKETLVNNSFVGLGNYDAQGSLIPEETFAGSIVYSRQWFDHISPIFDVKLSGKTDSSFHHHKVGSKSGWIHNDLHTVYIKENKNADGISAWKSDTDYWGGTCGTQGAKRVMTFIYFLNNGPWQHGDNGEIGLYGNTEYSSVFMKVPPIDNLALFFKCSENSWHAYVGDNKHERNSMIQFFLGDE